VRGEQTGEVIEVNRDRVGGTCTVDGRSQRKVRRAKLRKRRVGTLVGCSRGGVSQRLHVDNQKVGNLG
jgi:hypothetical protein